MDKLKLLKLAQEQDCEAYNNEDLQKQDDDFKQKYNDFYNDIKQKNKYIKEDW